MQFFKFDQVTSTQDLAKEYLKGHQESAVYIADSQTSGYGKRGRKFYSPANSGIYFSIALADFRINKEKRGLLTPNIATKLVLTLLKHFPEAKFRLKWVNDIYLNDKKVAGILTEFFDKGLVIGVGVNVSTKKFPLALKEKAGSITEASFLKDSLTKELIDATIKACEDYQQVDFLKDYRHFSNVIGKQVNLKLGKKKVSGQVVEIDDQGRLVIDQAGIINRYSSGEIIKVDIIRK